MSANVRLVIAFDAFLLAVFVGMAVIATGFSPLARTFPLTVSVAGVVLAAARLASQMWKYARSSVAVADHGQTDAASTEENASEGTTKRVVRFFGWILGYLLLIKVAGLLIATAIFITAFSRIEARMRWIHIAIVALAALAGLYLLGSLLGIVWPQGMVDLL